jgi:hydroxyacylglutathione hydrolase
MTRAAGDCLFPRRSAYMQNGGTDIFRQVGSRARPQAGRAIDKRHRFFEIQVLKDAMTSTHALRRAKAAFVPEVFLLEMQHGRMKNNNYLVVDPEMRHAVIVDPAWEMEKIEDALIRTRARLQGVLITHAHFDHIHLAKEVASRHDCPIWMSEREIAESGFDAPHLRPVTDASWRVGNLEIIPLPTPGHTPGCVCYLIGNNLFTGDVLFAEGCGICIDIPSANAMFDSLEMLKKSVDPEAHVFPGHTYVRPPGQRLSELMRYNMYLQFTDRDMFAAYRLRPGQQLGNLLDFR